MDNIFRNLYKSLGLNTGFSSQFTPSKGNLFNPGVVSYYAMF
jgi:hypothetical protein